MLHVAIKIHRDANSAVAFATLTGTDMVGNTQTATHADTRAYYQSNTL